MDLKLVVLVLIIILIIFAISIYNKLVKARNVVKNSFSQIDVQLKRRYDLIPNLVETAKAYMKHERETLEAVIQARNSAAGACQRAAENPGGQQQMSELISAEGLLGQSLAKMKITFEQYPDLKANTTMLQLMEELSSTENKISFARQAYNDSVLDYNNLREVFPNILLSDMLGFKSAMSFEITDATEKQNIKVNF